MAGPVRACAVVLLLASTNLLAQRRARPVRWLKIEEVSGELGLRMESISRKRSSIRSSTTTTTDTRSRSTFETLDIGLKGYVYHPRFLTFNSTLGLEVEQGKSSVSSPNNNTSYSRNSQQPRFSFNGMFLPEHRVSLGVLADHTGTTVISDRGDASTTQASSQEGRLFVKRVMVPTELFVKHSTVISTPEGFGEDRDEETLASGVIMTMETDQTTTRLDYEHETLSEQVTTVADRSNSYSSQRTTDEANLSNEWRFGKDLASSLNSRAEYRNETNDQTGVGANQTIVKNARKSVDERLRLQHTKHFNTHYSGSYAQETFNDTSRETLTLRAGLSHQLYESLFTNAELYGRRETLKRSGAEGPQNGGADRYGGSTNVTYRKRIPKGRLAVNLNATYESVKEKGETTQDFVRDESHVLSGLTQAELSQPNIDIGSIVVTDSTGAITYLRDVAYTIVATGNRVAIRRTVASPIADGATVLVDYSTLPQKPLNYSTLTTGARAQVDLFDHWAVYAGITNSKPSTSGTESEARLEELTEALVGTELYWGASRLTLEHVNHDSNLSPYVENRISLVLAKVLRRIHTVSANAEYRHRTFGVGLSERDAGVAAAADRPKYLTSKVVSLSYRLRPKRWPALALALGREQLDEDTDVIVRDFGHVKLEYRLRATEFELEYKIDKYTDNSVNNDSVNDVSHYLFLSITRSF